MYTLTRDLMHQNILHFEYSIYCTVTQNDVFRYNVMKTKYFFRKQDIPNLWSRLYIIKILMKCNYKIQFGFIVRCSLSSAKT